MTIDAAPRRAPKSTRRAQRDVVVDEDRDAAVPGVNPLHEGRAGQLRDLVNALAHRPAVECQRCPWPCQSLRRGNLGRSACASRSLASPRRRWKRRPWPIAVGCRSRFPTAPRRHVNEAPRRGGAADIYSNEYGLKSSHARFHPGEGKTVCHRACLAGAHLQPGKASSPCIHQDAVRGEIQCLPENLADPHDPPAGCKAAFSAPANPWAAALRQRRTPPSGPEGVRDALLSRTSRAQQADPHDLASHRVAVAEGVPSARTRAAAVATGEHPIPGSEAASTPRGRPGSSGNRRGRLARLHARVIEPRVITSHSSRSSKVTRTWSRRPSERSGWLRRRRMRRRRPSRISA